MSRTHCLIVFTGTMLAAAAIAASPAPADPHAQDAHERAVAAHQDLRSPDTRDAAQGAVAPQDLRSPDTRDLAEGRRAPVVVRVDRAPDGGLSWDSAGIGALVSAGLLFSLAGAFALLTRRRTRGVRPA